jgi:ATP-dependent RNA helicase DDX19/DBP5
MSSEVTPAATTPPAEAPQDDSLAKAQVDGGGTAAGGSELREPEFDVEVKLADMQADPNNPLFSVKTFDQLNLCVSL